jgi:geranylgeranyl pyrophosphate synthase
VETCPAYSAVERERRHGLCALDEFLERVLADAPEIPDACRTLVFGSKGLRARLLLSVVDKSNAPCDAPLRAAAAIELIHAASLIHDDIVDHCVSRRGLPTIHQTLDIRSAALGGWCLVQLALSVLGDVPATVRARFGEVGRELGRGQFTEILHAYDTRLLPEIRLAIMEAKTAAVVALASELGGMLNGDAPEHCQDLRSFGAAFGMLFQIADDLDDLFGDRAIIGRAPGSDLHRGVISLPIAFALQSRVRNEIAPIIDAASHCHMQSLERFNALLRASDALERTCYAASGYARSARGHLTALRRSSGVSWMLSLTDLTLERATKYFADVPRL